MKLRKAIALILAALRLAAAALAETPVYIQYGDTGEPIGWLQDCLGVTETCRYGYGSDTIPCFGDETLAALDALQKDYGLKRSSAFDSDTLYLLLDPSYSALDGYDDPLVWIPMYGGERYHANYWCSGLIEPRQMPASCAEVLGFTPCSKCYR